MCLTDLGLIHQHHPTAHHRSPPPTDETDDNSKDRVGSGAKIGREENKNGGVDGGICPGNLLYQAAYKLDLTVLNLVELHVSLQIQPRR